MIGENENEGMRVSALGAIGALQDLGAKDVQFMDQEGLGHAVRMEELDFGAFFSKHVRDPSPATANRWFAEPGEIRSFWLEITEADTKKVMREFSVMAPRGFKGQPTDAQGLAWTTKQAVQHTAQAQGLWKGPGKTEIKTERVKRMRLLLTKEMLSPKGKLSVKENGRIQRVRVLESKQTLLTEFVERFDRTFLPTVEVEF